MLEKGIDLVYDLGQHIKGLDYYDKALDLSSDDMHVLHNKGLALDNLGNHTEAKKYYDKALSILPNNVNALNNKGNAIAKLVESMNIRVALFKYDPNNHYGFFRISYNNLNYDYAQYYFALSSSHSNFYHNPVNLEYSLRIYDKALSFQPNDTGILTNKGIVIIKLKRYDEANNVFDKILRIDHNNVAALRHKGIVLKKMGNTDDVHTYEDQALQINPNYTPNLINKVSLSLSTSHQFHSAI